MSHRLVALASGLWRRRLSSDKLDESDPETAGMRAELAGLSPAAIKCTPDSKPVWQWAPVMAASRVALLCLLAAVFAPGQTVQLVGALAHGARALVAPAERAVSAAAAIAAGGVAAAACAPPRASQ